MKRREILLSSAAIALASIRTAGAQQEGSFRPTQRQVADLLEDETKFRAVLLGVDALRLNLLLTKGSRLVDNAPGYASSELPLDYVTMKERAVEGAAKLRGMLDSNSDETMKELVPELQNPVQISIEILAKYGVQPGSELLTKQATAFWTFLYTITESGAESTQSVRDWICSSNPFDALCG